MAEGDITASEPEVVELELERRPTQRRNAHLAPRAQPLDENPALVYLASLAPGSRRTMQHALDTIANLLGFEDYLLCPWRQLRFQHTAAIRGALASRYSAATANKMLSALRGTLKRAWQLGQMEAETYRRAVELESISGETPDAATGRALDSQELADLFRVCHADGSTSGLRDAAILALAYASGLRRSEIVALDGKDFDAAEGTLAVRGKRNKTRVQPVVGGALTALNRWISIRGAGPGPLFVRLWKGGNLSTNRLSDQAIYHILRIRAREAGVEHFSPHDLRRTFAGDLLDAGADIVTVQKLMGHADANTTARYDRRGERVKRRAVEKLEVLYPAECVHDDE